MAPVLGYWDIRGLAQPIRLMLAYIGTEFEDKQYHCGPAPDFDRSHWLNEKFALGLDFPNLPYYMDGKVKISQSLAIMRYLARKHGLVPDTEEGQMRVDIGEQQGYDFRIGFGMLCYNSDFENLKGEYLKNLPDKLEAFSKFLGKRPWFAGDKITHVDFTLYENLDIHRELHPTCFNDFPNLKGFLDRFENLPNIRKYMKSEKFMKWPISADMAKFGARSQRP